MISSVIHRTLSLVLRTAGQLEDKVDEQCKLRSSFLAVPLPCLCLILYAMAAAGLVLVYPVVLKSTVEGNLAALSHSICG